MLRRLFFLFPDEEHAQRVVHQLIDRNIPKRRIHAIARDIKLKTLPEATEWQKQDTAYRIEWLLWNANLLLFAFAFIAFFVTLVMGELFWTGITLAIMITTFYAGKQFVVHMPDVHLTEFTDALAHGEILLMVDVPRYRVAEIEGFVHHKYPEAVVGGVSWSSDAFGI